MAKLAINGGTPVRTQLFAAYNTIGEEEKAAVMKVLESGNLSQFLGAWHQDFYGGPNVRQFEQNWAQVFGAKYAITVNSNTSGLIAAVGACGVGPGDEVIVSPYTMSASAIAPVMYGAVPVFADICEDNFGLDPKSIEERITPRTKAILVVHIFGNPARMDEIMAIARKHNLKVIEDCAQSPLATYKGTYMGLVGDIGIYSLNYHKHIHTGEGGVIITNDDVLAEKCQLIRNHGEQVVEAKGTVDIYNTQGYNYRMTEMEAAVGIEQLKKLPGLIEKRIENANFFNEKMGQINGITTPVIEEGSKHVYYVQPFKYNKEAFKGVHRNKFVQALQAELPSSVMRENDHLLSYGYIRPLYLQPIYQQRMHQCSFNCPRYDGQVDYSKGLCPVTERMHYEELVTHEFMRPSMTQQDLNDVMDAFHKVVENIDELVDSNAANS